MRSRWPQPHYLEPDPISLTGFTQMCWESPRWLSMRHLADPICCHPLYQTDYIRKISTRYIYVYLCVCVVKTEKHHSSNLVRIRTGWYIVIHLTIELRSIFLACKHCRQDYTVSMIRYPTVSVSPVSILVLWLAFIIFGHLWGTLSGYVDYMKVLMCFSSTNFIIIVDYQYFEHPVKFRWSL